MWMNEAFAEYFAILGIWSVYRSKENEPETGVRGCLDYEIPEKNSFFFRKTGHFTLMRSTREHQPLYQKGRPWMKTIRYVYARGAMFVRMLESTIGEENFQIAMRKYISKYKHGNADHEQLWGVFEFANPFRKTNKTKMSTIFNSWIKQEGVPVVRVSRCNESPNCRHLKQHHFGRGGKNAALSPNVWYIPIQYVILHQRNGIYELTDRKFFLMPNTSETVSIDLAEISSSDSKSSLILNINSTGTYHVMYDINDWKNIAAALKSNASIINLATKEQLMMSLDLSLRRNEFNHSLVLCIGEYVKVGLGYHNIRMRHQKIIKKFYTHSSNKIFKCLIKFR